jgi:hypothetical protein
VSERERVSNESTKNFTGSSLWFWFSIVTSCMNVPRKRGKSVLITKETSWKNNLNSVKNVPLLCVNFIMVVIIIAEWK